MIKDLLLFICWLMSRGFSTNHQVTSLPAPERQEVQLLPCNTPSQNMVSHINVFRSFLHSFNHTPYPLTWCHNHESWCYPLSLKTNHNCLLKIFTSKFFFFNYIFKLCTFTSVKFRWQFDIIQPSNKYGSTKAIRSDQVHLL